jgi:hypothetical protein
MQPDDEQLISALQAAVLAAGDVPSDFVEAGQAAYAWRAIDAELAALSYDSQAAQAAGDGEPALAGMRAEPAALRALTFSSDRLTIEVQIGGDRLLGQVAPPPSWPQDAVPRDGSAAAECQVRMELGDGTSVVAPADRVGWFTIRPVPAGPFRLRVIMTGRPDVLTRWVTL